MKRPKPNRSDLGVSLVEVVLAVTIFAGLFLALIGASSQSLRLASRSQSDLHVWAATQRIGDSLIARNLGAVTAGTRTYNGVGFKWTVGDSSHVQIIVSHTAAVTGAPVVDTLVLYRN